MIRRASAWFLAAAVAGFAASVIPWEDLTEGDWLYAAATRFAQVDGHRVHYPTPTAELARLLEAGQDAAALRQLAEAKLALGDRKGALETMRRWAQAQGSQAWAETARWAAAHQEPAAALEAAERALPGLPEEERLDLAEARIQWAQRHPELADPIAMMQARSALYPGDGQALVRWVRALEKAGRLDEAERALAGAQALDPERRLLLSADLRADHGDPRGAFQLLDGAVDRPWSLAFRKAYAARAGAAAPGTWRATLETRFDAPALVRLATWFQGRGQGDAAADLLRQVERRYGQVLGRPDNLLLARLYGEIDAVPEAFQEALAAAHAGTPEQQTRDLASLSRLALRAGGRPLAWGNYNDESYRWVASLDRTPGFWTGAVSFLLTGVAWKETLDRLEDGSMPDRTFATARALAGALAQRAPGDLALPGLRVAIMERHVERGEGQAALDLLPLVETTPLADEARRVALLAAQSAALPRAEEMRLFKARLRYAAPDGSRSPLALAGYKDLLNGAIARLDALDPSHRAALDLSLTELDRMPDAEELWLDLAGRLEGWNLDDDLGPRYQRALDRFQGPGLWAKAARWYARRAYHAQLRQLGAEVAARFRGAALFQRADAAGDLTVAAPGQPGAGRVRMVLWADWVRLKALERFPHSPQVFREASRLVPETVWKQQGDPARAAHVKVVVPDALVQDRRWAVLFADAGVREAWFAEAMRQHSLEAKLEALEAGPGRTPVEDLLLFEGWARLSRFERAAAPADRLAAAYPGDGALAQRALALHRSLNALESSHFEAARALVARTAPALEDPAPLWTELGEMEEERGRPREAVALWGNLLAGEPRDPAKVAELATLLWDYGHDPEALAVVEAGRKAMGRPRFYAFETGVLRENLRDLEGAVREYLDAARPEDPEAASAWYYQDPRSLRRLAQLLARDRVFRLVAQRIQRLAPGSAEDERDLAAFFPLATFEPQDPRAWADDQWIDFLDQPVDPRGRAARRTARSDQRPAQAEAIRRMGDLLLAKVRDMVPRATSQKLLDFAAGQDEFIRDRWSGDRMVVFQDLVMARKAELAPSEEDRVSLEIQRARFLSGNGRMAEADAVWAGLTPRIERLPEGTARIQAEAQRAGYLERGRGIPAAAQEWRRLTARYPWSLGLLEDRLSFLARAGLGEEGRELLEQAAARAGAGYREDLLQRLAKAALEAGDLLRARRAAEQLLGLDGLEDQDRLRAAHVLARLSFQADPGWDALALARLQEPRLKPERRPELYRELARAADLERAPALGLWIETLNRRTEKAWLLDAARSAARAGKGPELLAFFQRQRERSPRDVRWAVAVRDLRRAFHDVPGAIEAAKAAVKLRPDQESLWHDAADILVRADRIREAADFMEGWNRPRPADEGVARFRGELYERAGDAAKALAVEQGALAAFAREAPGRSQELAERRTRAADRLMALGHADLALRLLSPRSDVADLAGTRLSWRDQADLALLTGQFPRLVETRSGDAEFLAAAGAALAERGRPEAREAVQARLAQALFPAGGRPDSAALDRWWPFIGASDLEPGLRAALAQRLLESRPGPWQKAPPFAMVLQTGNELIHPQSSGAVAFREPDLPGLWCRELAREGRGADLLAFIEPRWRELMDRTRGADPLSAATETLPWASWLQDPAVLKVFARAAAARPGMAAELAEVMGSRPLWDRFWALAARRWEPRPLVAALPEQARAAWFRFWEPQPRDPVLQARRRTVEQVGLALGRLLQGVPGAAEDPLVARLRGPRTVGGVLGADARWTWPDFNPGPADQGDDLVLGQGADRGRLPGALWGERPGPAWYVLEALARYRQGDAAAPRLPLVSPEKGGETQRAILAVRLARAMKDLPLALDLAADGPDRDLPWLEAKLSLLVAAGRRQEATGALKAWVRAGQATLTEAGFQNLAGLAGGLGLPGPMACLDPERPVGPAFLAYLQDLAPGDAARFRTGDELSFRAALAERWRGREARLTPAQLRTWLRELWARGAAGLPQSDLARLGPVWPCAVPWLQAQAPPERPAALQALAQAMDAAVAQPPLLARLTGPGSPDSWRLLALRLRLIRGETAQALALVDGTLAGLRRGDQPSWEPAPEAEEDRSWDPLVARLQDWLRPFRAEGRVQVEERFRAFLAERRQQGPVSAPEWQLALRLCPGAQVQDLLREMDEAWFRGELEPYRLPDLLPALAAAAPSAAPGWLARCPGDLSWTGTRRRAGVLAALKQPAQAGRALVEARRRALWTAQEEGLAFQFWRQWMFPVPAPGYWQGALAVWSGAQALGARLQGHPQDILSARSALETLAPLDPDSAGRATLVLGQDQARAYEDRSFLELRAARWRLTARPAAAAWPADPRYLVRLLTERGFPAAAMDAARADLARADARGGDEPGARAFLDVLAERGAPSLDPRERMRSRGGLQALAAELPPPARADPFKLVDGRPASIRPRDLTWAMLANVLKLEGAP